MEKEGTGKINREYKIVLKIFQEVIVKIAVNDQHKSYKVAV